MQFCQFLLSTVILASALVFEQSPAAEKRLQARRPKMSSKNNVNYNKFFNKQRNNFAFHDGSHQKRVIKPIVRPQFNWGYFKFNGPSTWQKHFSNVYGREQSPINIETKSPAVGYDRRLKPLRFNNYTVPIKGWTLKNNARGFFVEFGDQFEASLNDGPLTEPYQLHQLVVHWGVTDKAGSEHRIDGHAYAAELQFVHYNKEKYGTFDLATKYSDGLAIFSVFLELGSVKNVVLETIASSLKYISHEGQSVKIDRELNLTNLLPKDSDSQYWTYFGSLTQPPLTENTIWIIIRNPAEIEKQQLAAFRKLYLSNLRPVQPLNDRVVRASFRKSDSSSSKTTAKDQLKS